MLGEQQVKDFYERGWFVLDGLFGPREIARARAAFERLYDAAQELRETQMHNGSFFVLDAPGAGPVVLKRVVWAGGAEPDLLALGADPRLLGPALQLLGAKTCEQLLCQAHFKMPHDGVSFDWHQDIQHRDKGPGTWTDRNGVGSYVQTILLIDDMTPDNGPLQFVPTPRMQEPAAAPAPPNAPLFRFSQNEAPFARAIAAEDAVTVTGKAGSVLVFGPYAVHGSAANISNQPRRVLINGYAYPGANGRVYPGEGAGRILPL
jgi:ectoine hydroxylase-related dioxygenase (phytanoyl-CoA dioxygenase family)